MSLPVTTTTVNEETSKESVGCGVATPKRVLGTRAGKDGRAGIRFDVPILGNIQTERCDGARLNVDAGRGAQRFADIAGGTFGGSRAAKRPGQR
jgi:hypothetical protein